MPNRLNTVVNAPSADGANQMSKVELSDAELIATLKATAWRFHVRLTARNAELDELRKIVERVTALCDDWALAVKEGHGGASAVSALREALAPAQKEAPVEAAVCARCGHAQALHSDYDKAAAVLLCRKSGCDCDSFFRFNYQPFNYQPAPHVPTAATDARHQIEANMASKFFFHGPWGETTAKKVAEIIMDAVVQYAASARKE